MYAYPYATGQGGAPRGSASRDSSFYFGSPVMQRSFSEETDYSLSSGGSGGSAGSGGTYGSLASGVSQNSGYDGIALENHSQDNGYSPSSADYRTFGNSASNVCYTGEWMEGDTWPSNGPFTMAVSSDRFARVLGKIVGHSQRAQENAAKMLRGRKAPKLSRFTNAEVEKEISIVAKDLGWPTDRTYIIITSAVQNLLHEKLYAYLTRDPKSSSDISAKAEEALEEAAYHLQFQLSKAGADNVKDLSSRAVSLVLKQLQEHLQNPTSFKFTRYQHGSPDGTGSGAWTPSPPGSAYTPETYQIKQEMAPFPAANTQFDDRAGADSAKSYTCNICLTAHFRRDADRKRHIDMVHTEDDKKMPWPCDYKNCRRHKDKVFFRSDHCRDHYRSIHMEDLLIRGKKPTDEFWSTRSNWAMGTEWWRCTKCLDRVRFEEHGVQCGTCQTHMEPERQEARGISIEYP